MTHTDPRDPYASHPGDHHYSAEELHNADVAHEHSDVNVRTILMYAAGLVAVAAVVHVLVYGVFVGLEAITAKDDPQLSPLAAPAAQMPASTVESPAFGTGSGPKLLTNEYRVLAEERAKEAKALEGIQNAKKNALGQIPARAGAPVDPRLGTAMPARGESSSGRVITGHPAPAAPGAPPAPAAPKPPSGGGH